MKTMLGIGAPLAGIILAMAATPSAAAGLVPQFAACIRENAPKVEQAIPSLNDGVEFLIGKVCAPEASAQLRQELADAQAETRRQQCERQKAQTAAGHPPIAGLDMCSTAAGGSNTNYADFLLPLMMMMRSGSGGIAMPTADGAALAAKLLLDLRLARQAREGQH